jgi:hypothetical protein
MINKLNKMEIGKYYLINWDENTGKGIFSRCVKIEKLPSGKQYIVKSFEDGEEKYAKGQPIYIYQIGGIIDYLNTLLSKYQLVLCPFPIKNNSNKKIPQLPPFYLISLVREEELETFISKASSFLCQDIPLKSIQMEMDTLVDINDFFERLEKQYSIEGWDIDTKDRIVKRIKTEEGKDNFFSLIQKNENYKRVLEYDKKVNQELEK